jgi:ATP phosphoribosyltransferase
LWNFYQQRNRPIKAEASNFPLEVLYLRNSDIPQYLIDGVVDIAIVGDNLLVEKGKIQVKNRVFKMQGFCSCTKAFEYNSIKDLDGLRIATSYPILLTSISIWCYC